MRSLLERKKVRRERQTRWTFPEREAAANNSTAEKYSQIRVRLESYGVTFPDRRNFTSSTSFYSSPEEEEEQLCMAKQLSLGSIPFDKLRKQPIFCCPSSLQMNE